MNQVERIGIGVHACAQETKFDKKTHTINLDKEDMGFLAESIEEVVKKILKGLSTQQMQVANKIIEHVNKLTYSLNEVKTIVEAMTYGIDLRDTLAVPLLFPPPKLELQDK